MSGFAVEATLKARSTDRGSGEHYFPEHIVTVYLNTIALHANCKH